MPLHQAFILSVTLACAIAAGCSRKVETAAPVATPTATLSASEVAIGGPMDVTYKFVVARDAPAFAEDYTVFVHFLDSDRDLLWTDDHQPPTPTRQWKPGETIEYKRSIFVPKLPHSGNTTIEVGLYSTSSGARLPLAGQDTGMRSYRVAALTIGLLTSNVFVVFKGGWHDTEVAEGASGEEWQWSKKEGVVSFRNPKRDVTLLLQLDQPARAFAEPQRVTVSVGPTAVDTFTLPSGERQLRRINIAADQLGAADTTDVTVAVDRTFIPSAVAELKSSDSRELGVRVFRVYIQPR
jgi:hypothetical protein